MSPRKLAALVLHKVKAGSGKAQQGEASTDSTELDLVGDREFLTAELASEALAPLLASGSAITKVHPTPPISPLINYLECAFAATRQGVSETLSPTCTPLSM